MSLDRFAIATPPGAKPIYSQYGYCIHPDGTVYALTGQYFHGVVLCFLFPDVAKQHGFALPANRDEMDEFQMIVQEKGETPWVRQGGHAYQDFELKYGKQLNCLRVGNSPIVGPAVDRGIEPATPAQIASLREVLHELDVTATSHVETNLCRLKVSEMWDFLVAPDDPFPHEFRKSTKDPYDD